jgi:two-component system response regulator AtoC
VRVIAATHRDLESAIVEGTFREDLYYRLNIINVRVPPLRERPEDIVHLAELLLRKHKTPNESLLPIPASLRDALLKYNWPGNIRELENVMRRYIVFRDAEAIASELRARGSRRQPVLVMSHTVAAPPVESPAPVLEPLAESAVSPLHAVAKAKQQAESVAILNALQTTHWNRKRAAALLNIDYKALLYRMKKLSLSERSQSAL